LLIQSSLDQPWLRHRRSSIRLLKAMRPSEAGSGTATLEPAETLGELVPKVLRTLLKSVRSMVAAWSKLPSVHEAFVLPKLFKTTERSVRSTLPSSVASPGRADPASVT